MKPGLDLSYLWHDSDVLELRIFASNGKFSGSVDAYVSVGALVDAAMQLEGFPLSTTDVRELQIGAFGPHFAGGAVSMRFFCKDGAGHAVVEIRMEADQRRRSVQGKEYPPQSAYFYAGIEAVAIDDFVGDLRKFESENGGRASLKFR